MVASDTNDDSNSEPTEKKDDEDKPANPDSDEILSSGGALFGAFTGKDPSTEEPAKPKPEKKKLTKAQIERQKKAKAEVAAKKKKEAEAKKKAEEKKKKEKEAKEAEQRKIEEAKAKREEQLLASMTEDDNLAKEQDHSENDYFKIKNGPISGQE